jgi:hypothetical protein
VGRGTGRSPREPELRLIVAGDVVDEKVAKICRNFPDLSAYCAEGYAVLQSPPKSMISADGRLVPFEPGPLKRYSVMKEAAKNT